MIGKIVLWHQIKAFGFIELENSKQQYFVHVSNFPRNQNPRIGATVEFEVGDPISLGKPPQAVNARIIAMPEPVTVSAGNGGVVGGQ